MKQVKWTGLSLAVGLVIFAGLFEPSASLSHGSFPIHDLPAAQKTAETTQAIRRAALIAATDEVLKETSEIRKLPVLRPVPSSTQSRVEIQQMVIRNLDRDTTPAQLHAAEVMLMRLGLAPRDFQYRALMIRLLTEQVAGYYDPRRREFHLADWIDLDGQKPIIAHELVHALQDQHFNLGRFEHWPKGESDAELAAHALIEGDATFAMTLYVARNPMRALAFLKSLGATGMTTAELDKAPRALRETLLFPYQEGTDWTKFLYREGGWDHISRAFTELPQSTEQILHPEKYVAREWPVKVTLPDITSLLNTSDPPGRGQAPGVRGRQVKGQPRAGRSRRKSAPPGSARRLPAPGPRRPTPVSTSWRRLDYNVQGEWGFYLILNQFLSGITTERGPGTAEARRAAGGWGGDRFAVYEGPKGEVLFVSSSTWDTETDAREFFEAYVKRTELRYPGAQRLESQSSEDQNRNATAQTPRSRSWSTNEGPVVIELRGARVLILEGLPGRMDSKSVIKALWQ